jgi:hypothetical protein
MVLSNASQALFEQLPEYTMNASPNKLTILARKRRQVASPEIKAESMSEMPLDSQILHDGSNMLPGQAQNYDMGDLHYANAHGLFDINQAFPSPATPNTLHSAFPQAEPPSFPTSGSPNLNQQSFPLADLSAMMFPNPDPFAYPTQPVGDGYELYASTMANGAATSGSNGAAFPYQSSTPTDLRVMQSASAAAASANASTTGGAVFMPPSSTFLLHAGAGAAGSPTDPHPDVQLLGPLPMYLMQGASPSSPRANGATALSGSVAASAVGGVATAASSSPLSASPTSAAAAAAARRRSTAPNSAGATPSQSAKFFAPPPPTIQQPATASMVASAAAAQAQAVAPNINLDALLGGEEWAGLPADRRGGSGGGGGSVFVNPRTLVPREGAFTVRGKMFGATSMAARQQQQQQQAQHQAQQHQHQQQQAQQSQQQHQVQQQQQQLQQQQQIQQQQQLQQQQQIQHLQQQQQQQQGQGVSPVQPDVRFGDLAPGMLGWGLEGF